MAREDLVYGANIDRYGDFYHECAGIGWDEIAAMSGYDVKNVRHWALYPLKVPGGVLGRIESAARTITRRRAQRAEMDAQVAAGTDLWLAFARAICSLGSEWSGAVTDLTNDQLAGLFIFARELGWDDELGVAGAEMDARAGDGTAGAMTAWLDTDGIDPMTEAWRRIEVRRIVRVPDTI